MELHCPARSHHRQQIHLHGARPSRPPAHPAPGLGAINPTGGRGQFSVTFPGRNIGVVVNTTDNGLTWEGTAIVPGKGPASLLGTVSMTKK